MENMMKHALKEHRIRPEKMLVLEHGDSRQEAYITMRSEKRKVRVTSKDLAETLSSETHRRWRPAADSRAVIGRESRTVKFEEDTEFLMLHGIARAVKNEENLSGDTFAFTNLPMGRFCCVCPTVWDRARISAIPDNSNRSRKRSQKSSCFCP